MLAVTMRIALLPVALPLLIVACQRADRSPPEARSDTARAVLATAQRSPVTVATAPRTPSPLEPALDSACTLATRLTRESLGLELVRDSATIFTAPREGQLPWHGCRLSASSPGVQKDPAHPVMPDGPLQAAFLSAGWKDDFDYGADGPDGTELGMRKGDVLCHLGISYPGSDSPDDDSAEPPADSLRTAFPYSLVIRCTRKPRPVFGVMSPPHR